MAMPLIGAGTGGLSEDAARTAIEIALAQFPAETEAAEALEVLLVSYQRPDHRTK